MCEGERRQWKLERKAESQCRKPHPPPEESELILKTREANQEG